MVIGCLLFSGSCLWYSSSAQVTVENTIATDTVDVFSAPAEAGKSPALAIAASLLLPGSGHHYLDRNRSALTYFTVEAAAIFGFFFCDHYSKKLALDAAGYAWIHSGAQGPITDADDSYWKKVGQYMDVQDYNTTLDLNRSDPKNKITDENRRWHWDGESSKDRFNSIMSSSRSFHVVSSFCIGALVLDRIIAFIDIRSATRTYGTKQTGRTAHAITIRPRVSVSPSSIDLRLAGSF
jgi:hypothetical protein